MAWIREATSAGARKRLACAEAGLSLRTFLRWTQEAGQISQDQRAQAQRPEPANKLSEQEREQVLAVCNQPDYAGLPPSQIVPRLADQGVYLASESSFYRILKAANQLHHRGRAKDRQKSRPPTTHQARAANEVWTWYISYLPSGVRGRFFYLYLIVDIFSRKIVGWEVHEQECGEAAAALVQRAVLAEHCWRKRGDGISRRVLTPLPLSNGRRAPARQRQNSNQAKLRSKISVLIWPYPMASVSQPRRQALCGIRRRSPGTQALMLTWESSNAGRPTICETSKGRR